MAWLALMRPAAAAAADFRNAKVWDGRRINGLPRSWRMPPVSVRPRQRQTLGQKVLFVTDENRPSLSFCPRAANIALSGRCGYDDARDFFREIR